MWHAISGFANEETIWDLFPAGIHPGGGSRGPTKNHLEKGPKKNCPGFGSTQSGRGYAMLRDKQTDKNNPPFKNKHK